MARVDTGRSALTAGISGPEQIRAVCPRLPSADDLAPYLRRIDAARVYTNNGPLCAELEARLSGRLQLPAGGLAAASSGTSALIAAILATAGRASETRPLAIVPAFTFPATAYAVECCGFVPYLVDIEPHHWMLDPVGLCNHPMLARVGLVVPVATFGRPVDQTRWLAFRSSTQIPVVIDGAASFDRLADERTPQLGDVPVALSFHATKSFAVGEGGGVASSNIEVVMRAAQAMNFGLRGSRESRSPGLNGKMSEYHAAVGLAELDGWNVKYAALRRVADRYLLLLDLHHLGARLVAAPDVSAAYVLFRCSDAGESSRVRRSLELFGVGHRLWYEIGLHRHSVFADAPRDALPVTELVAPCVVGIPVAPDLSEASAAYVVEALVHGLQHTP